MSSPHPRDKPHPTRPAQLAGSLKEDKAQATHGRLLIRRLLLSEPAISHSPRRFGVTCLYLLLTYKEAADIEVNYEDPDGTLIEVPDDKGHVTAKPFGDCSVDQMRRALQRLRKPVSSKPLTPEAEALAEQYSEAVTGRFPKGARVKVLVRNQKGKAVLDFKGIPLEQVGQLVEALSGQLPPVHEVRRVEPPTQG